MNAITTGKEYKYASQLTNVTLSYKKKVALDDISLSIPANCMVGLIGPDGVGKSSLMSLIAGVLVAKKGTVETLEGNIADPHHRDEICSQIAYMPQGLGKNLYPTLSVEENLQFFGSLFGLDEAERKKRIDLLTKATHLYKFLNRPAGKLSGGMKQKLGLCSALIHNPALLILDEPTTGVDPLSRIQFWELIEHIRHEIPLLSIIVSTAYMDEAEQFDWLVAMDAGKILATGTPQEIRECTNCLSLETAFVSLLAKKHNLNHRELSIPPLANNNEHEVAIEARDLTKKFGCFTAVNKVSFKISRGEIFGFLGSNGCGKSTTMKMLTGLIPATEGTAWLFGHEVDANDIATRKRVGYMSQGFSLYSELSVRQNLELHARLFHVPEKNIISLVADSVNRFGLHGLLEELPSNLPLGIRQRLSLAVAMIHKPDLLILDEPTSGVDPIARDNFWHLIIELARKDKVTVFISTHFMNEAMRCDRISLMNAGEVLVSDTPNKIIERKGVVTLEQAFIAYLKDAEAREETKEGNTKMAKTKDSAIIGSAPLASCHHRSFSIARALSYAGREAKELRHDPVRGTLALFGSLLLMLIMGFGISLDVEKLSFAVLDRDQTMLSRNYALNLAGSRYFVEHNSIENYADLDRRMRSGELSLAIEIPPGFARDLKRGNVVQIGAWVDGAMPQRAETIQGYAKAMHYAWLSDMAMHRLGKNFNISNANVETRFRYNPDVKSLPAMVPAIIPILLLMIPAMMTALAIVREKELGSIINFYVTPVTRTEFLLGKQLPYIALGMLNFFLMVLAAYVIFGVTIKGSFITLSLAALIFISFSTGFGLFASIFTRSQIAALFLTMIGTMIPSVQFSGLLNPISSLEGVGRLIGEVYPATHFFIISRGVFTKALKLSNLYTPFLLMLIAVPVIFISAICLLKKREN